MPAYLITGSLNGPEKDYENFNKEIKNLSESWWHHLESTWIIKHPGPSNSIRDVLNPHLNTDDELLVVRLSGEGAWVGFGPRGRKWLNINL